MRTKSGAVTHHGSDVVLSVGRTHLWLDPEDARRLAQLLLLNAARAESAGRK